jgi:signal transduction histidine kinase
MTNTTPEHILVVEDNPADARLIEEYLTEGSWPDISGETPTIRHVDRLEDAVAAVDEGDGDPDSAFDIILLDLGLPDSSGLETLDEMLDTGETIPIVVLTGLDDERVGVDAVERGAQEYLVKDDLTPRLLRQTLRNAIQRELQQRELQQRNAELALLNQVVRHDIRNDVAVILSWGETLDTHVDETGETYLNRIVDAGEHITDITETVGDFLSVLEDGTDPELQAIDLEFVLLNEVEKARSAHEKASITLTGDHVGGLRVAATELLSSVFRNLLKNAVTHNDKSEPEVAVQVEENDDVVTIRVADNGPGIPDSQKQEIFGRGEMGLESSGSGIGLYLVDTLVEMYSGSVELTDNDPDGSVFTVELQKYDT